MRIIYKIYLILLFLAFTIFPINLRVYITEAKAPFNVEIKGRGEIINAKYETSIKKGSDISLTVNASDKGVKVESVGVYSAGVKFISDEVIVLNGTEYKGNFTFINHEGEVIAVNEVELEDYVTGVLPYEMSPSWPIEALKAQALAARSYSLHHYLLVRKNKSKRPYDVDNTTRFQVYRGLSKVNDKIRRAVKMTEGEVITFGDKVILAFFHASCGGYTETAFNAFKVDIPYLRGTYCPYSKSNPQNWVMKYSFEEFSKILKDKGKDLGLVDRVYVVNRAISKSAKKILILGDKGRLKVEGKDLRHIMGAKGLPSLYFDVDMTDDSIVFKGSGRGHGVGLSQWGAYGMAENGFGYRRIIKHYYKLVSIDDYRMMNKLEPDVWKKEDTHVGKHLLP